MTTAISKPNSSTALSTTASAIAAAAQEEGANELGALLKYSKGHYFVGTEEIPLGTEFIAHVEHWVRGWVKFKGGSLIEHRVGRVTDGFAVPERDQLDEADQSKWELGPDKQPKDPWTKQSYLPFENPTTGEIVTFVSGSVGGRQAISKLCSQGAKHIDTVGMPVIKIGSENYKHKVYGRMDKPVFTVVRWVSEAGDPVTTADAMNDDLPF
jgi:hypothetical protein